MKRGIVLLLFSLSLSAELKLDFSREYDSSTESFGTGIAPASDGLFLIGGIGRNSLIDNPSSTPPEIPLGEAFFAKVDSSGEPIFETVFGDGTALSDFPVAMVQSGDYTYITGITVSKVSTDSTVPYGKTDIFLGKFNSSTGATEWITQIGTAEDEEPTSITADSNGTIYISGESSDGANTKHLLLEYNSSGDVINSVENSTSKTEADTSIVKYEPVTDRLFLAYSVDDIDTVGSRIFLDVTDFSDSTEDSFDLGIEDELIAFEVNYNESSGYTEFYFLTLSSGYNKLYKKVYDSDFNLISEVTNDTDVSDIVDFAQLKAFDGRVYIGDYTNILKEFSAETLALSGEIVVGSSNGYSYNFSSDGDRGLYVTGETIYTIGNSSPMSKYNLFIANYRPIVKTIPAGWSLLSGNIDISRATDSITVLYNYDNWSSHWRAFSPIESINSALIDYTDLPQITEFKRGDGMWVLASEETDIEFSDDSSTLDFYAYPDGWSLNGTDQNVSVSSLGCLGGNLMGVWKYSEGAWQVSDNTGFPDLTQFTEISEKEGFWVNCEPMVMEDPLIE
jgi:hypothetical protein